MILVGVVSPVSEILKLSKTAKFPFRTMDYSPWSSKKLIDQNRLKKFMQVWIDVTCMYTDFGGCDLSKNSQVWIDVTCMYTDFGGCGLSGFGDTKTLKNGQISLSNHGL